MTVEIPSNYQAFVKTFIDRGQFETEEQVVGEALRLFAERNDRLEKIRSEIQVGIDQLDHGDYTEYDAESLTEFFDQLKAESRTSQNSTENKV
jgi:antitoxin ParD1/3/4